MIAELSSKAIEAITSYAGLSVAAICIAAMVIVAFRSKWRKQR